MNAHEEWLEKVADTPAATPADDMVSDTYEDEEGNYTGPVIELYISASYDARTHRVYTKAPSGWAGMTKEEREKFVQAEADSYASEHLEIGGVIHKDVKTAIHDTRQYWGDSFSEDQLEDMFG